MAFEFGSAFVRVVAFLDRKQITAESAAAGDAAGTALNTAVTKKLTANQQLGKAIGLSLAGAFGIATARGLELEKATARVRAETGLTGKAAEQLGATINRLAGKNLASIDEIADAFSKVHNDLGLTGDAAEAATQSFLTFARATGQTATGAVTDFDDILDGFNLTADRAAGIMDQLVASHQRFGGSITASQQALAAMAPSLQAMNVGVDEGVGLLNLFAASGIDAGTATALLARGVKALKPGQDLDDLIAQLGAIEDPTLRAQKAVELFGRSGGKLANAIKPGTTSIDEFIIKAGDVPGATDKAREAIDSTFGAQVQLLLHQFGATVTDVLGSNGPVLNAIAGLTTLAGSLGLDKVIKKAWTALGGSRLVQGAIALAGAAHGVIYGAAVAASQALVGGLTTLWNKIPGSAAASGAITGAGNLMGTTLGKTASKAFGIAFVIGLALALPDIVAGAYDLGQKIRKAITGDTPDSERIGREAGESLAAEFAAAAASNIAASGPTIQAALRAAFNIEHGTTDSSDAGAMTRPLHEALLGLPIAAAAAGKDIPAKLARGITEARQAPLDALDALIELMKHPLSQTAETTRLIGQLTGKALADGLTSADPAIRHQALVTRNAILERLDEIEPRAGTVSAKAMDALATGMKSKDSVVRAAATKIYETIQSQLDLAEDAKRWALALASNYAATLAAQKGRLTAAAQEALGGVLDVLEAHSPPGPKSPLHDIEKWAEATGLAWIDSFVKSIGSAPDKIKNALGWVQKQFTDFVANYNPIGSLFGGLTPEADRANLTSYIGKLRAALPKETDPAKRLEILQQILDYEGRLAALQGENATTNQNTAQTIQGYISNLDKALLTATDPARIKKITDELLVYLARLDAILHPKVTEGGAAGAAGSPTDAALAVTPPGVGRAGNSGSTEYFNADTSGLSGYAVTNPDLSRDVFLPGGVTYHTAGGSSQQGTAPTIIVNNPTPEPASQSVPDALRMIGAFG